MRAIISFLASLEVLEGSAAEDHMQRVFGCKFSGVLVCFVEEGEVR